MQWTTNSQKILKKKNTFGDVILTGILNMLHNEQNVVQLQEQTIIQWHRIENPDKTTYIWTEIKTHNIKIMTCFIWKPY